MKEKQTICEEAVAHEWDKESIDYSTDSLEELELTVESKICGAQPFLCGEWRN